GAFFVSIRIFFFFFSSRRRHTRSYGDWSSDVCSSDLSPIIAARVPTKCSPVTQDCGNGSRRSIESIRTRHSRAIGTSTCYASPVRRLRSNGGHVEKGGPGVWDMGPGTPRCGSALAGGAAAGSALDGRERQPPGGHSSGGLQA